MRLELAELQKLNKKTWRIKTNELKEVWNNIVEVLYQQRLPFMLKTIGTKLLNQYHSESLISLFSINKTKKLIGEKYHWLNFRKDVESYIKNYDGCLGLKTVKHKPYSKLQALVILTHQ